MKILMENALVKKLLGDEKGLAAVEYAVLGAIVVGAIVAIGTNFKSALATAFAALFNSVA
ncbi:MAG: Flp family type IVb pilin [Sphingobium sp.]|nr:Flp family type IVb pilin [Sphingobium sp.]